MKTLNKKPNFETESRNLCNVITKIDNEFLQAWVDAGAYVMSTDKDFCIMTNFGQLLFKIHDHSMHLECISVIDTERRKGNGTKLMEIVIEASDETNTPVSLKVANVTGNGFNIMQSHVIAIGMVKKDKIPVASLPKWYEKFGFKKTAEYSQKKKEMIYKPKNK